MVALQIVVNPMGSRVIGGCYNHINHPSLSNKAKFKILSWSVYFMLMLEYVRDKNFEISINPLKLVKLVT